MSKADLVSLIQRIIPTITPTDANALADAIISGASSGGRYGGGSISLDSLIDDIKNAGKTYKEALQEGVEQLENSGALLEKQKTSLSQMIRYQFDNNHLLDEQNVKEEETLRYLKKQHEITEQNLKSKVQGLSYDERRNKLLQEFGEKIGINTDKFTTGLNDVKKGISEITTGVKFFIDPWGKIDQAAANYTKTIGGSVAGMNALRESTIKFVETQKIGAKYNTSMEELIKLQQNYNTQLGRSIGLTNSQKENMAAMRAVMGDELTGQFTISLANFGMDPDKVADMSGKMFSESAKKGIVFEKYSKNFLNNIKMAQNYTFANGVEGLRRMAEHATKMNMDMNQTARFAEKVSTVEGALQTGAKLSVLGGTFSQFSNPLALMNMGLNDMESLQNTMEGIFSGKARWNAEKGQLEMSTFDRQRLKAFSEATGTDYQSNLDSVFGIARRHSVEGQLTKFRGDSDSDKEMRELILNTAQLDKEGNAYITIDGKKRNVNEISENDKEKLQINKNSDSDNIRDIATRLRGWEDTIQGFGKQKDTVRASIGEMFGEKLKGGIQWLGESWLLKPIAITEGIAGTLGGILRTVNGIWTHLTMFGNRGLLSGGGSGSGGGPGAPGGGTTGGGFGFGGKFGTKYNYTKGAGGWLKDGAGNTIRDSAGKAMRAPTTGMKAMKAVGKFGGYGGLAAGLVGGAIDIGTEMGYQDKRKDGWYVAGKTAGRTLELAGTGATLGSMFGPVGTLVGAGIGAAAGFGIGLYNSQDERRRDQLRRDKNIDLSPEEFSHSEVSEIYDYVMNGKRSSNGGLRLKLNNEGYTQRYPILRGFKRGGYTGDGNPNEVAGLVHKGEIVIPHSKVEPLKAGVNSLAISKVIPTSSNNNLNTVSKIKVEPLKIDVSGTIKLDLGNQQVNITANDLLKNQGFINELSKRLESQITMAYVKENRVNKFSQINL